MTEKKHSPTTATARNCLLADDGRRGSTPPDRLATAPPRRASQRRWVGDLIRLVAVLTALISAISHFITAIGG